MLDEESPQMKDAYEEFWLLQETHLRRIKVWKLAAKLDSNLSLRSEEEQRFLVLTAMLAMDLETRNSNQLVYAAFVNPKVQTPSTGRCVKFRCDLTHSQGSRRDRPPPRVISGP